ncbi:MAG: hypothetical protein ABJH98_17955 [Reichenbachiella sp.]|uniref:hypothetical protein n=1 Tax=Reichenbachiella sp. TaxID=2184521 RepID=UPI003297870D
MDTLNLGFERLKKIDPNFTYKSWFFETVKAPSQISKRQFFTGYESTKVVESVDASKIVATYNQRYYGKTWIEMLGSLRSFERCLEIEGYLDRRDNMSLSKYGEEYQICLGSHRSCISKFLDRPIKNIEVTEYQLDSRYQSDWDWFEGAHLRPIEERDEYWRFESNSKISVVIKKTMFQAFKSCFDDFDLFEEESVLKRMFQRENEPQLERVEILRPRDLKGRHVRELLKIIKNKYRF